MFYLVFHILTNFNSSCKLRVILSGAAHSLRMATTFVWYKAMSNVQLILSKSVSVTVMNDLKVLRDPA